MSPQQATPRGGPLNTLAEVGRRTLGLVLIVLVAAPVFNLLQESSQPTLEAMMRRSGNRYWAFSWLGAGGLWTYLLFAAAAVVGFVARGSVCGALATGGRWLAGLPTRLVMAVAGVSGAGAALIAVITVYGSQAVLNDASVQLLQARYLAMGLGAAGVPEGQLQFWSVQFMVPTENGWVSQYPPGHAAVLALGFLIGAPWIAMVAAMAVVGGLGVRCFEVLLPDRVAEARIAAIATALSPLLVTLAAGYMSHATVAAFAVVALFCALRAGGPESAGNRAGLWAAAAGAAMGAMVIVRPVTGLLIGLAVTVGVWLCGSFRALARRLTPWALGGLPFAVAFAWHNHHYFGNPFTLGYVAASGPSHGLGFHVDPWGREYGPTQALGYTSTELSSLGQEMLGAALPVAAFVGLALLAGPRLSRGMRVFAAWALLPVLASALNWHHDMVFGPRMLGEATPAWMALFVVSLTWLAGANGPRLLADRRLLDAGAVVVFAVLGVGIAAGLTGREWGGWGRVARHGERVAEMPEMPDAGEPLLVFVHEPWPDRLGGRLGARGMRLDSLRAYLGSYHPCQIEATLAGGATEDMNARCQREYDSDRLGALGLTIFLWQGDLPGAPGGDGALWARDLGPEANARLIAAYPERSPRFLARDFPGARWRITPYEEGLELFWGAPAGAESSAGDGADVPAEGDPVPAEPR